MIFRILLLFCFFVSVSDSSWASIAGEVKKGNQLYQAGQYDQAVEKYDKALQHRPESDIINFDLGTAYYKKKEYPNAVSHLQKALLSDDPGLRFKASYNLGNALYYSGIAQEKTNVDLAISSLEQALTNYENVLKADVKDEDAKYNYDIVKKELARLKKKQQSQSQQCPNPKKKDSSPDQQQSRQEQQSQQNPGQQSSDQQKSGQTGPGEQKPQQPQQGEENQDQQESGSKAQSRENDEQGQGQDAPSQPQPQRESSEQNAAESTGTSDNETMNAKAAQILLRDYQQREEPKGLLNFQKHQSQETPVTKDW